MIHGQNILDSATSEIGLLTQTLPALAGKVALVVGGARGAGAEISMALAHAGAHVAVSYSQSGTKTNEFVERLQEIGGHRAIALKHDPGDTKRLAAALLDEVLSTFRRIDVLIHASSLALHGKALDDPTANNEALDLQWQERSRLHRIDPRGCTLLLFGGRIIALSSGIASRVGITGAADYAGTKAAVLGYTKGVAKDLAARMITANVVLAGFLKFETPRGDNSKSESAGDPSGVCFRRTLDLRRSRGRRKVPRIADRKRGYRNGVGCHWWLPRLS